MFHLAFTIGLKVNRSWASWGLNTATWAQAERHGRLTIAVSSVIFTFVLYLGGRSILSRFVLAVLAGQPPRMAIGTVLKEEPPSWPEKHGAGTVDAERRVVHHRLDDFQAIAAERNAVLEANSARSPTASRGRWRSDHRNTKISWKVGRSRSSILTTRVFFGRFERDSESLSDLTEVHNLRRRNGDEKMIPVSVRSKTNSAGSASNTKASSRQFLKTRLSDSPSRAAARFR